VSALIATGLVKRFGDTRALDGVAVTVAPGEVRGLLGLNGAGKTTLLRVLLGLVRADAGNVALLGSGDPERRPRDVAGCVEEPSFYPYLTGRANLELLTELDGTRRDAPARIDTALKRCGLNGRSDDRVAGYSTGMRQRLQLAAALLRAPRLLLLDEPTSGLDPAGLRDVARLVRELADGGAAVLLSSHQIGEVEAICDTYTVLREGRVAWDGSAAALRAQAPSSNWALETADDARALELAEQLDRIGAGRAEHGGLRISAEELDLDRLTVALGRAGIAIRRLEQVSTPLESMFFTLTAR